SRLAAAQAPADFVLVLGGAARADLPRQPDAGAPAVADRGATLRPLDRPVETDRFGADARGGSSDDGRVRRAHRQEPALRAGTRGRGKPAAGTHPPIMTGTPATMTIQRMTDLDLTGKRVLIRQDLNVPVDNGKVTSDQRLTASLPTLRAALDAGAAVMVMSHLGRPKEGSWSEADSLAPVAARLG